MTTNRLFPWYQRPKSHRHGTESPADLIHSPSRLQFFPIFYKQRQLLRLVLEVGKADPQETDRLSSIVCFPQELKKSADLT